MFTVTDIVSRLEGRKLVKRMRSRTDKRRVQVRVTRNGEKLVAVTPPLLQKHFLVRFAALRDWEQGLLLSSLQRVAEMMDADAAQAANRGRAATGAGE